MNYIILIIIITVITILMTRREEVEGFDFEGKYLWYRDPYSIKKWEEAASKQRWWNAFHRRQFLHIDNYMYLPIWSNISM